MKPLHHIRSVCIIASFGLIAGSLTGCSTFKTGDLQELVSESSDFRDMRELDVGKPDNLAANAEIAKLLMSAGADVNAMDARTPGTFSSKDERAPLHYAARKGPADVVQVLFANKATDVSIFIRAGMYVLLSRDAMFGIFSKFSLITF